MLKRKKAREQAEKKKEEEKVKQKKYRKYGFKPIGERPGGTYVMKEVILSDGTKIMFNVLVIDPPNSEPGPDAVNPTMGPSGFIDGQVPKRVPKIS